MMQGGTESAVQGQAPPAQVMLSNSSPSSPPPSDPTTATTATHADQVQLHEVKDGANDMIQASAEAVAAAAAAAGPKAAGDGFGRAEGESKRDYLKREFSALKPFVIISLSYLLFTTTDGVCLHNEHVYAC